MEVSGPRPQAHLKITQGNHLKLPRVPQKLSAFCRLLISHVEAQGLPLASKNQLIQTSPSNEDVHQKRYHFKKVIFQPLIFRGYYYRVVDLARNQSLANPGFTNIFVHRYHLRRIVAEHVLWGHICNLESWWNNEQTKGIIGIIPLTQ